MSSRKGSVKFKTEWGVEFQVRGGPNKIISLKTHFRN